MSCQEAGETLNLPPGSSNIRDDIAAKQLKFFQLLLWKNLHYLTGTEMDIPLLSTSALSQLAVSPIIQYGSPPPEPLSPSTPSAKDLQPLNSLFEEFISKGGPSILSNYLLTHSSSKDSGKEMAGILTPSSFTSPKRRRTGHLISGSAVDIKSIPSHSLAALNIFFGIPLFAKIALQDQRRAAMLLRFALSVSDDEHGGNTLSAVDAELLPSLPFVLFQSVLENHPPNTREGADLRQQAVDKGALQFLLALLAVFTQQVNSVTINIKPFDIEVVVGSPGNQPVIDTSTKPPSSQQQFWAKGTGYGSGSTTPSWDADEAIQRQRYLEEQAVCLLRTLAAFIHPSCSLVSLTNPVLLPADLMGVIQSSHLIPAICSYLRNDSMMFVSGHIPVYKAIFHLLRAIAGCSIVSSLLVPPLSNRSGSSSESQSIFWLLRKLRNYIPRYAAPSECKAKVDDPSDREEIAELSEDLCTTWSIVKTVVISDYHPSWAIQTPNPSQSPDKLYCDMIKPLLFDSYAILIESSAIDGASVSSGHFTVAYHFENVVRQAGGRCHPNRMKRLAQEVATLKTSLPLAASSSIFVRCDTDRVDIMKVLITGPADTPYSNGCFEFDVYFPPDYPQSPMKVHFVTTGRQSVRFNPNLYMDGKVCLSVLNTWTGQPEEMWNSHTSSLLQVLISIQSLILVSEPYFNEPGLERSRGTPSGDERSRDYDANIRQATVNWAMLQQIKNPSPCFKEVIQTHFLLKRKEIEKQCEDWISDMEKDPKGSSSVSTGLTSLKVYYGLLKDELARLSPPVPSAATSSDDELNKLAAEGLHSEACDDAELSDEFLYDEYSEDEDEEDVEEEDISEDVLNPENEDEEETKIDNKKETIKSDK